jgi:hypothetical protein
MLIKKQESNAVYLNIIKDNFVQRSSEDNPEAIKREYEDSDGNKGEKWEIQYEAVEGYITAYKFNDGRFGEEFEITLESGDSQVKIQMGTGSRYFMNFGEKFPNINFKEKVKLSPYDLLGDNGKTLNGITVYQGDTKVVSNYYDADKKKSKNGIPSVAAKDRKGYDSDDWKMHFIQVKKFLKKEIQKINIPVRAILDNSKSVQPTPSTEGDSLF